MFNLFLINTCARLQGEVKTAQFMRLGSGTFLNVTLRVLTSDTHRGGDAVIPL